MRRARQCAAAAFRLSERLTWKVPRLTANSERRRQAVELAAWWRRTYFSGGAGVFKQRLSRLGPGNAAISVLARYRPEDVESSAAPWRQLLDHILAIHDDPSDRHRREGFSPLVKPFLDWGVKQFGASLGGVRNSRGASLRLDSAAIQHAFLATLLDELLVRVSRTCLLELSAARMLGMLKSGTPEERFQEFVETTLTGAAAIRRFLDKYPVLGRVLATTTAQAVEAWSEMIARLKEDWAGLESELQTPRSDVLNDVLSGVGDHHCGGRTVMILTFRSGCRLVYKPKSLAVDRHFADLVEWINRKGLQPTLRAARAVDRGSYGWAEFIPHRACRSEADVRAFYRRQGALLALLQLLNATDCHNENLIASGAHPVLIDLETLFHNLPPASRGRGGANAVRQEIYGELVIRTGLLPQKLFGPEGNAELSGLSGAGEQISPFSVPRFENSLTDEMRIVYGKVQMGAARNMPVWKRAVVPIEGREGELVRGFTTAYRLLESSKAELLSESGPIVPFRKDRVRYVARATHEYAALWSGSFHPGVLQEAPRRDFHFDALWKEIPEQPHLRRLVESEQDDLWSGDIPYFWTNVGSVDLFDSRGKKIPKFFRRSAYDHVRARIEGWGSDDLERQLACLRVSLASARIHGGGMIAAGGEVAAAGPPASADRLVEQAAAIGERLLRQAIPRGEELFWSGLDAVNETDYRVHVATGDLYSGNTGIALFLAQLGHISGRHEFTEAARAAFRGALRDIVQRSKSPLSLGAYNGPLSILYGALYLARLWSDNSWLSPFDGLLRDIPRAFRHDRKLDLMGGAAGGALVLLRWHLVSGSGSVLEMADAAGRHLMKSSAPTGGGIAWPSPTGGRPLLGLSHGAAGIAWALAELGTRLDSESFRDGARSAIAYEQQHFTRAAGNWPDFRSDVEPGAGNEKHLWSWCHGAPGIGIARLMTSRALASREWKSHIMSAVRSTMTHGFGGSHSLCHGDLGNADFLLLAAADLRHPPWRRQALRHGHRVLESAAAEGAYRCGIAEFEETPELMVGLSGIGYGLLRLASPEKVPSILALELPSIAGM